MLTLEFDFEKPDDKHDFDLCYCSVDMFCALDEIASLLRSVEKGYENNSEEMYNEELFDRIREHLKDSRLWDLQ